MNIDEIMRIIRNGNVDKDTKIRLLQKVLTQGVPIMDEDEEKSNLEAVVNSSHPDEVLTNAESIMRDSEKSSGVRLRAELTYVQLGIINPLAMEFIEATGIAEENNA